MDETEKVITYLTENQGRIDNALELITIEYGRLWHYAFDGCGNSYRATHCAHNGRFGELSFQLDVYGQGGDKQWFPDRPEMFTSYGSDLDYFVDWGKVEEALKERVRWSPTTSGNLPIMEKSP